MRPLGKAGRRPSPPEGGERGRVSGWERSGGWAEGPAGLGTPLERKTLLSPATTRGERRPRRPQRAGPPSPAAWRRGTAAPPFLPPSPRPGQRCRLTSGGTGRFSAAAFSSSTESVWRSLRGAAGSGRRSHRLRRSRTSLPAASAGGGSAMLLAAGREGVASGGRAGPGRRVGGGKRSGRGSGARRRFRGSRRFRRRRVAAASLAGEEKCVSQGRKRERASAGRDGAP